MMLSLLRLVKVADDIDTMAANSVNFCIELKFEFDICIFSSSCSAKIY